MAALFKRLKEKHPRLSMALLCLLICTVFTLVVGGIFALLFGDFRGNLEESFWSFGAPFLVSILFLFNSAIPEQDAIPYGCGLYYGTIATAYILKKFNFRMAEDERHIISFIIAALVCYIVYLKRKDAPAK